MESPVVSQIIAYNRFIDENDLLSGDIEVKLTDVYRALPKINRFNGLTKWPYSVAKHSFMCCIVALNEMDIRNPVALIAVLFHDAPEAYIGDIIRPIKYRLLNGDIKTIEEKIMSRIYVALGFSDEEIELVQQPYFKELMTTIDNRMAVTEADQLCWSELNVFPEVKRYDRIITESNWQQDLGVFRACFHLLLDYKQEKITLKVLKQRLNLLF